LVVCCVNLLKCWMLEFDIYKTKYVTKFDAKLIAPRVDAYRNINKMLKDTVGGCLHYDRTVGRRQ